MTELEFWTHAKRALERLNPRILSSGGIVNTVISEDGSRLFSCCAVGAYDVHMETIGRQTRIEPKELFTFAMSPMNRRPGRNGLVNQLIAENEDYCRRDNTIATQLERWLHVHAFVNMQIRQAQCASGYDQLAAILS